MFLRSLGLLLFLSRVATAAPLVLDRSLRAESAKLPTPGRVEGAFGFEYYRVGGLEDEMGSPFLTKWTVSPHWQLRLSSVGWTGEAKGFLSYSELHDIKLGAQYTYWSSADAVWDASLRALIVGVDTKKQRYLLTALWSANWASFSWDVNAEVTVPLQGTAMPLKGTLAMGGKWWADSLGVGLGCLAEFPSQRPAQHFLQTAVYYRLSPEWVVDLGGQVGLGAAGAPTSGVGGQNSFGIWNANFMISAGVSFLIQ